MLNNLKAEIKRESVSNADIAKALSMTDRTLRNKLNGVTEFNRDEMFKMRDTFFPKLNIEYLFHKDHLIKDAFEYQEMDRKR